jgi:hypothetical protein
MVPNELLTDYSGWTDARTGERLSLGQYLGHLLERKSPTSSLVIAMLNLAYPEIKRREQYVLVEELFSRAKLQEFIAQGKTSGEVEYWMNLLALSAIFDALTGPQLDYVADTLQKLWAARLSETGIEGYECRLLRDEDEWYLTICRKDIFCEGNEKLEGQKGSATVLEGKGTST